MFCVVSLTMFRCALYNCERNVAISLQPVFKIQKKLVGSTIYAQVHKARFRSGEKVVVKVQHK